MPREECRRTNALLGYVEEYKEVEKLPKYYPAHL